MEMKDYYLRNEWTKYLHCKHMINKCRMDMRYYGSMMDYHYKMCLYLDDGSEAPSMPGYDNNYMAAPPWTGQPDMGMFPGMGQQFPMMPMPMTMPLSPEMMMPAGSNMQGMPPFMQVRNKEDK